MPTIRDNDTRYAEFLRIIDGDTFQARIHLATKVRPRVEITANIRVQNWSAAELNEAEGKYMRDRFEEMLRTAGRIDLQMRGMSFERIVCSVWLDDELFAGILTHELLSIRSVNAKHTGTSGGLAVSTGVSHEPSASGANLIDHVDGREGSGDVEGRREGTRGLDRPEGR